ncbi:hypothetical protein AJ79_06708 [Helicocarpus griseus UAMH5409]|uniref:Uncharacterized protein n=1 Tax=Helicocarpus griseus UAMH5409 TaxID=1447875 RepID=A0A2B7X9T5_9EURO|nr:hypothetical protein AJ79_06708 [Helicocarpus griseus UAMH5409]
MPIKLPKGFARRKSSGNALEDIGNAPEPSFRVFERPAPGRKSFDGATTLNSSNSDGSRTKRISEDPYANNIFANTDPPAAENRYVSPAAPLRGGGQVAKLTGSSGSRGTNNSASTGPLYDSSSSAKYSSSSTLPSSADIPIQDVPVPPPHDSFFSLRSAGRTFSFGARSPKPPRPEPVTPRVREPATRERATTASTTSTATPPRLPDTKSDMGDSMNFGNMFDGLDKENERPREPAKSPSPSPLSRESGSPYGPPPVPAKDSQNNLPPLHINHSKVVEPPPHSNESRTSRDGLMSYTREDDIAVPRPLVHLIRTAVHPDANGYLSPTRDFSSPRSYRNTVHLERTSEVEDEDAKIVNSAVSAHRRTRTAEFSPDREFPESQPLSADRWLQHGATRQPSYQDEPDDDSQLADAIAAQACLAEQYEQKANHIEKQPTPKVMTPAQFERYRHQKEMARRDSYAASASGSDDDSDHYEDEEEDEAEKAREAAKQRKRQEAHLSVYRQQMMKVTGETAKARISEPNGLDKCGLGSLNEPNRSSFLAPEPSTNGKVSDGEDDEDIPLAILAAHGFPNKARPPGHLTPSISNPNLRASVQSFAPAPPSIAPEPAPQATRSSLPVFARNLPRDPYNVGAGLVNPSHRESLAMGGGSPSVYGAPPGLPPGGLVGVIANEERAKAMRRGSPNARGPYDGPGGLLGMQHNNMSQPQFLNVPGGSPMGVPSQPLYPAEQTQAQMSQMAQMMQTQIQWMQSMMQMQGMPSPGGQPMPMGGNGSAMGPPTPNHRPVSMVSNGTNAHNYGPPQVDHRTLSLLDPKWNTRQSFIPPQDFGPGYATSVAPSERSNVGTASRYRPVSTVPQDTMARSSTFTSTTLRPWNEEPRKMSLNSNVPASPFHLPRPSLGGQSVRPGSGLRAATDSSLMGGRATPVPNRMAATTADDEDEDEGWAEMMKNREKKKSSWKFKKTSSSLGDLFHHHQHTAT